MAHRVRQRRRVVAWNHVLAGGRGLHRPRELSAPLCQPGTDGARTISGKATPLRDQFQFFQPFDEGMRRRKRLFLGIGAFE
jgi:hypothetical protein